MKIDMETLFTVLLSAFVPTLIFLIWFKRRREKRTYRWEADSSSTPVIDEQALRAAEAAVRGTREETRKRLLETHALYDRFNTIDGFDESYMATLLSALRDNDINCETLFQESAPLGVGASVIAPQGFFELYVPRAQLDTAAVFMKQWLQRKS